MKPQINENENLDRIERKLLSSRMISADEIEKIIASPQIFDSVLARIKVEENERKSKTFFSKFGTLLTGNKQKFAAAFAVLIFFLFFVLNRDVFNDRSFTVQTPQIASLNDIKAPTDFVETTLDSNEVESFDISAQKVKFGEKAAKNIKRAARKTEKAKHSKPSKQAYSDRMIAADQINRTANFYALSYAGDLANSKEDLQIIRTEMTPASLFAIGVNYPIENEKSKIKTDLLVGQDGIARAIRFVD